MEFYHENDVYGKISKFNEEKKIKLEILNNDLHLTKNGEKHVRNQKNRNLKFNALSHINPRESFVSDRSDVST